MEWRIFPLDVLFFRGTEPMNAGEAASVASQFPPSPEVMQGFVRTALLDAMGVSVHEYARAVNGGDMGSLEVQEAIEILGGIEGLGRLDLYGPYLVWERGGYVERWYPAPLELRRKGGGEWRQSSPGSVVECDIGAVPLLPKLEDDEHTAEGGMWISEEGLAEYLQGQPVPVEHVVGSDQFYCRERRVGIERNVESRATREGMLYAPEFVRLKDNLGGRVGIGLRVEGVDPSLQRSCAGMHRLGGEGRLVVVEVHTSPRTAASPDGHKSRLILLTPARWDGQWIPPGFQKGDNGWHGTLGGVRITIVSAALGKPLRIGGWDIVRVRPKPAEACVPAGSVYFLRPQDEIDISPLHNRKLGTRSRAGFGHVMVGR